MRFEGDGAFLAVAQGRRDRFFLGLVMAAVKEKAALRELARLHDDSFLGSNAQYKKASVDPTLPQRLRTLFHGEGGALEEAGCGGGRRLVPVYCDPPIYIYTTT